MQANDVAVGVVAPFDFALDRELWRWVPENATLHLTRTPFLGEPVNLELADALREDADVRVATRSLLAVDPDVVAYACTSGSFVRGVAGERHLVATMREAGARNAVTTSGALIEALQVWGIRRIAVATPYVESVTARLNDFLGEAGVDVVSCAHLGLQSRIWTVPGHVTERLVRDADSHAAEAVFVSCTNLPTYDLVSPLEQALGKPVLTANQVTLWAALTRAGERAVGAQRLLRVAGQPTQPQRTTAHRSTAT